ncbi:hypothetical protein OQA88_11242 [Cercophora sp. LCS_1]
MRLLLVRHGETVDNVAGLYAGIRDSPLTAHGVLQARRLGAHLATRLSTIGPVTHVFSSDLQRAANTAQAVIDAQPRQGSAFLQRAQVRLVKLPELRERNFGSAEGKRFGAPRADAESHEAMRGRADIFVRGSLVPLLRDGEGQDVAVVVSHGIFLNALLRVLLTRFAPAELERLAPSNIGALRSDYIVSWSNTGYVEMVFSRSMPTMSPSGGVVGSRSTIPSSTLGQDRRHGPRVTIVRVNSVEHLVGLKKTRGGIGSAQFDSRQRTVDSFFTPASKKRRVEER